ncbi:MAG: MBL fold metallo-hydrolase [Anaerolineae bacterium]
MELTVLTVGRLQTNCYLVVSERGREALVVDPGGDLERILAAVERAKATVQLVVLTHFHFDHLLAAEGLCSQTGAPLAIHHREAELLTNPPPLFRLFAPDVPEGLKADRLLHGGDILTIGDVEAHILETPGHSPGGISVWLPQGTAVLSGDALFREGVGRTDFPGSSQSQLAESIRQSLFTLPDETAVYPGHGPSTTIGHERQHNPWMRPGR